MKVYYFETSPKTEHEIIKKQLREMSQHSLAYFLLEQILRQEYPDLEQRLCFDKTSLGKPYLKDHPEIHFNISHCPMGIACAVGQQEVGVDIEKRFPWKDSLAKRICSETELAQLESMDPDQRQNRLNLLWSCKESYLKCIGTGIRTDLRKLNFMQLNFPQHGDMGGSHTCEVMEETGKQTYYFEQIQTEYFTLVGCGLEKQIEFHRI